jgi:hypothetical protein
MKPILIDIPVAAIGALILKAPYIECVISNETRVSLFIVWLIGSVISPQLHFPKRLTTSAVYCIAGFIIAAASFVYFHNAYTVDRLNGQSWVVGGHETIITNPESIPIQASRQEQQAQAQDNKVFKDHITKDPSQYRDLASDAIDRCIGLKYTNSPTSCASWIWNRRSIEVRANTLSWCVGIAGTCLLLGYYLLKIDKMSKEREASIASDKSSNGSSDKE